MHLQAEQVLHIEHVDNTLAVSRHCRCLDLQAKIGKRSGQPVKQARKIAAIDLDHRMRRADPVRKEHPRRHGKAANARRKAAPALVQSRLRAQRAGHRRRDTLLQPRKCLPVRYQFIVCRLQLENVKDCPVGAGGDARTDDVDAEACDSTGNTREQPGIIDCEKRQFRDLALGDLTEIGQQWDIHITECAAKAGMPDMHVGIEPGPVGSRQPCGMIGEFPVIP